MTVWTTVQLGDVIERIVGGKNLEAGSGASPFRIMKVSAVTSGVFKPDQAKPAPDGHIPTPEHHVREGDFLFSRANTSELVGAVAIARNPPDGLLLPDKVWRIEWNCKRMHPRYAYSLLRSARMRQVMANIASGTSGSMKNISKAKLVRLLVSLPSIDDQRRIVGLLDRAVEIRRRADVARAKARAIIPALFLDMFGDPATNPKGWRALNLGDALLSGPQNGLYRPASDYGEGTRILRIDSFDDGSISDQRSLKRLRIDATSVEKFSLHEGDIVVNRVNSPPRLGKSILVSELQEPTVFESNMMRMQVNPELLIPAVIGSMLQLASVRQALIKNAKHAINQSSINQQDVMGVGVFSPPLPLQTAFADQAKRLEATARALGVAAAKAEAMAAALSAEIFTAPATQAPIARDAA